ncbi:nuclear transport factor 2 family protein [Fertoebacter nigrum]|uniref:Nuclear transport factor 2 family protein n=1 Tax=Fertoeibacter niger TaxID=2656921 RepID=A0A8X8GVC0_9RHOB|nr:nuclear transport factor 2 family protein [Fertoeibacter niger]NUB45018.1 nuclear transport factor 2 family protein [Fertoeibacter niger]
MTESDNLLLAILRDEREIVRVIQTYARGSDRKDFAMMRSAYHDGAIDNHGPVNGDVDDFLRWSSGRQDHVASSLHLLGSPVIDIAGDVAVAETCCLLYHWISAGTGNPPLPAHTVTMACRYVDRFERRQGQWKIAHRTVAYDGIRREFRDVHGPEPIAPGFTMGRRSKDDIIYRALAELQSARDEPSSGA